MEKAEQVKCAVELAKKFKERVEMIGHGKGKKADLAALEFFCGAGSLAIAMGDDDFAKYLAFHCQMIAVRGMSWVNELVMKEGKLVA